MKKKAIYNRPTLLLRGQLTSRYYGYGGFDEVNGETLIEMMLHNNLNPLLKL